MRHVTCPIHLEADAMTLDGEAEFNICVWMGEGSAVLLPVTVGAHDLPRETLAAMFGEAAIRRAEAEAAEWWREHGRADARQARAEETARIREELA